MSKPLTFEPKWFVVFIFFLVGVFIGSLGLFIWFFNNGTLFDVQKIHPKVNPYKFINPILAVDYPEPKQFLIPNALETKIRQLVNAKKNDGSILEAAVYFRDIEPGEWMGVNEDFKFSPGTLLKIPIMVTYFKNAESDPKLLNTKLKYHIARSSDRLNDETNPSNTLINGQTYTIEDLISAMIQQDDDGAAEILFDKIDKRTLNEVYSDLGFDFIENKTESDFVSVKMYALLFRVLYNATYLNREMSEKALQILSDTSDAGFSASLPQDAIVAHKSRTRIYSFKDRKLVEIHDCGIIYYPSHPYLLCMMDVGRNPAVTNNLLKEISLMVYNDMDKKYTAH